MKKQIVTLATTAALTGAFATTVSAEDYNVNKGDTLWSISQKYNVSVSQLKSMNGLSSNIIYPGQNLSVDGQASSGSTAVKAESNVYTVKSGDTLYSIAQSHGASVSQVKSWNNLSSNLIHPGDQLAVGSGAAVKASTSNSSSASQSSNTTQSTESSQDDVVKQFTAEATAYTAYCTGCSGVTATGQDLRANPNQKVIAVDPNVIPLGSKVWVEGYGTAIAGDTGGAINGNRIDVFMPNRGDALDFGRRSVTVKVLD
ncbi:LysM peptidoglycan-binding domain-containing protein [Salimicrobium halophilum]|uniref:3D (Asp-Asp-Asp) domain-containing protein n=1 Tax=Salimicrobium halophilum TaxID=86666 RepID=A0A1G8Q409_9BACI|nr:LysM peptidoglycan-binding domain-containing protein [Salimicrobium halophilum]SDI99482.1 3D (Asp-Asp-Asp) domain-containing protein [Salimicrobium halophilum]